jgi:hypothetical protein
MAGGDDDSNSGTDAGGSGSGSGSGEISMACKHMDVVISVDNSGSMGEEKMALRDIAFPGFAQALKNAGGGLEDFRVGVLDACPSPANFHTSGIGGPCNFSSGKAWIESSSPAFTDEFKCVADLDYTACQNLSDEQPATAATAALMQAGPNGSPPNGGFLREDALLVVVAITDEDEQPDPDLSAQEVYNKLVAIKGGDIKKMVFLGIGGAPANGEVFCDGAYGTAIEAKKLKEVTNMFIANQRGVFWDLCQGNLEQGLTQALTTIDSACDDFGPIL